MNTKKVKSRCTVSTALCFCMAISLQSSVTTAMEAIEDLFANEVRWEQSGISEGTVYQAEAIGGVYGNFWIDLKSFPKVGQTFRCAGPILAGIQLGMDNHGAYKGLQYLQKGPGITVTLRKDGPGGQVVTQRAFTPEQITADLPLMVDEPSDASVTWYVELAVDNTDFEPVKNTLNATTDDVYPQGQLYLNGRSARGDLHLRIHRGYPIHSVPADGPGVILWSAAPEERIWRERDRNAGLMARDDRTAIVMSAAGNERVSAQLVITSLPGTDLRNVEVDLDPFCGPAGTLIDASNISIEWLRYSREYYNNHCSGRLYPDPLAPTAHAELSPGQSGLPENVTFWITVHVPANTRGGKYASTARVTVNQSTVLSRPVVLEVFDFSLPLKTHTRSGLFRAHGGTVARHLWWAGDLADFRLAIGSPFHIEEHAVLRRMGHSAEAYQITLGTEMQQCLVKVGNLLNQRGLDVAAVMPWEDINRLFRDEAGAEEGIRRFWEVFYPILQEHDWLDQAYTRMKDEFKRDTAHKAIAAAQLSRQCAPEVRIVVTAMNEPNPVELNKAVGMADIWCPSSRYLGRALDFYLDRQGRGESIWPYIHDHLFHQSDPAGARMFFWMLERYGFEGVCYWCVGPRGRFEHTDFGIIRRDGVRQGDGSLYYPGTEEINVQGLWRSARLHRIRDGIEDREYFFLMNELADRAEQSGDLDARLKKKIAEVNRAPHQLTFSVGNFLHVPDKVDHVRRQIAGIIEDLRQIPGSRTD